LLGAAGGERALANKKKEEGEKAWREAQDRRRKETIET